jgi:hypothetical protein
MSRALGRSLFTWTLLSLSSTLLASSQPIPSAPGYVSGRAATAQDVDAGNAGFVLQDAGVPIGRPIATVIPQYARFTDGTDTVLVVLIQAEEARGQRIAAGRTMSGEIVVGLLSDFTLLGTSKPAP